MLARYRRARNAALLSACPGLGHAIIGERSRSVVYLTVTFASVAFLLFLLFGGPLLQNISATAAANGMQLNQEVFKSLNAPGRSYVALGMYVALFIAFATYVAREAYDRALKPRLEPLGARILLGLPETTSGSYLLHVAVMAALLVATVITVVKPPEEIKTAVEFELEPPPPPPPPPPVRRPPPKPETTRTEKPRPQPQPKSQPKPVAVVPDLPHMDTPSPITEAPPQPAANPGPATGTGASDTGAADSGADAGEPDFSGYLEEMEKKIKKAWFPPRGSESKKIVVKFKLNKQGEASSVRLGGSSGIAMADEAAVQAVKNASPFGTLPKGADDPVEIKFTFDYNVTGGGAALRK
ncbi:MAG TPA: energy transducer TonB [Candidatus Obscuribacterales bacterium]